MSKVFVVDFEDHWGPHHRWAYTDAGRACLKADDVLEQNALSDEHPWGRMWFGRDGTMGQYREIDGSEHIETYILKVTEPSDDDPK